MDFFQGLEKLCDDLWNETLHWSWFAQKSLGMQLTRSLDSADANLAEGEGRWHGRDQLKHMYIARGSLHEARRWLLKSLRRGLLVKSKGEKYLLVAESILRRLNGLITYRRRWLAG